MAAVVVAAWYAMLTRRLARTADTSARAALQQAGAARAGAEATADQARSTRLIFEAAHRPYVQVTMESGCFYEKPKRFRFHFLVKNHGPVPAVREDWQVRVGPSDRPLVERRPSPADPGQSLFPGEETLLRFSDFSDRSQGELLRGVELVCTVRYRGLHDAVYSTRIVATSWHDETLWQGWQVTAVGLE